MSSGLSESPGESSLPPWEPRARMKSRTVTTRERGKDRDPVINVYGAVGQGDPVSHGAVVSHVHVGHDPVAAADTGDASTALGAAIEGEELANHVTVADLEP